MIEKKCEICEINFLPRKLTQKYCSNACKHKAFEIIEYPEDISEKEKYNMYCRYRYKNNEKKRQYCKDYRDKRRKEIQEWFHKLKSTKKCYFYDTCKEKEPCCLDFHHKDPSKKDFGLNMVTSGCYSKKRVLAEIEKCVVLCANCHRKYHAGILTGI